MALTIRLFRKRRRMRGAARKPRTYLPLEWESDGDEPDGGVREPRRPITPLRGGAVALPLDEID